MARQVNSGAWFGEGAEEQEASLLEAIRFCSDMAILGDETDPPNAYDDDPRVLYRGGEVLE